MLKFKSMWWINIQVLDEENVLKNIDCVFKIYNFILLLDVEMLIYLKNW